MPGWGAILAEAQAAGDFDSVRHKYLDQLFQLTGRSTVIYESDWLGGGGTAASITLGDMQGLMEVFQGLPGPSLDLILHSPGGQAEATDSLVSYMRSKYADVRVFVPLAAMSAATMWSLAADKLIMGKHSQLGPIDPQVFMAQNLVPASALVRQFQRISDECAADATRLSAWLPTLQQYWPGLLEICRDADDLARSLVEKWLAAYMFKDLPGDQRAQRAQSAANYFASTDVHLSHNRPISRDDARNAGLSGVVDLEEDQQLQEAVLSAHHATLVTLQATNAIKIIENHIGNKYVVQQQVAQFQIPMVLPSPGTPPGAAPAPPAPGQP